MEWEGGEMGQRRTAEAFPILFMEKPGGDSPTLLEEEKSSTGLPSSGGAFGEEDRMTGPRAPKGCFAKATQFPQGKYGCARTGREIFIQFFVNGREATATVKAAVIAADGENGNC